MDKQIFARALAHALNHNTIGLTCRESWNGFTAGQSYLAIACGSALKANDDNGLDTHITENAAHFFDVEAGTELAQLPTDAEKVHQRKVRDATELALSLHLFEQTTSRPFARYDVLEWKPGLCNRRLPSDNALMIVTEVLPIAEKATEEAPASSPAGSDYVDLRVGVLACSAGREDDTCMHEVLVDSRRVQLWGGAK